MENPLIITGADYALLLAHAKSAVMIHNTDNNAVTQIKLRWIRKIEEVEQRVKPAPGLPVPSKSEDDCEVISVCLGVNPCLTLI